MNCLYPIRDKDGKPVFSCGKCIACRINITTMWTKRLYDELQSWGYDNSCFVTLTYSDEFLPKNNSLVKDELSRYFKRLRKDLSLENRKIKVFAAGEYGDKTHRPHYHAIIFGLSPYLQHDRSLIVDNWKLCDDDIFVWKHRGNEWLKGNAIDYVSRATFQYVAKYVQKRLTGSDGEKEYTETGRIAPYSYKSNGLGLKSLNEQAQFIKDNGFLYLNGEKVPVPKYYRDKLGVKGFMNPEKYSSFQRQAISNQINKTSSLMVLKSIEQKYISMYGSNFYENKQLYSTFEHECQKYLDQQEFDSSVMFEKLFCSRKGVR